MPQTLQKNSLLGKGNQPVNSCSTDSHFTTSDGLWYSGYVYVRQWQGEVEAVLLSETVGDLTSTVYYIYSMYKRLTL